MEYVTLGRTGLKVSVAGLGCGGFSRIGQSAGSTEAESVKLIQEALDLGVNFIDTARNYRTESVVGKAIAGINRDDIVISTKVSANKGDQAIPPSEVIKNLDQSLGDLGVETIDVFHLHGVSPQSYDSVIAEAVPALLREKEKGKFRHLGITEVPPSDPYHDTLQRAVHEDCFDVMMVAFHMLHQSAREKIFRFTLKNGIGTLIMFAVRYIFSQPGRVKEVVEGLASKGVLPSVLGQKSDPLDFLIHEDGAKNVIDAAYRYCRHEPGTDVTLFGTGSRDHLKSNIASLISPPLPEQDLKQLRALFGTLEGIGLDAPGRISKP